MVSWHPEPGETRIEPHHLQHEDLGDDRIPLDKLKPDDTVDMNDQELDNIKTLNMSSATELTISSGAVTATQGHHSIDTESNAATDDLDTINGLDGNDLLLLFANNGARTVRIRNGEGNIFLRHQNETKAYHFSSPAGSSGIFYSAGEYFWPTTDANLTQASASITLGTANIAYGSHVGIVAGAAGAVDTGVIKLTVAGTTIDDNGTRNASQTVTIVADITALSTDQYVETTEKWIGQVTLALATASGSPTTYSLDFNYGFAKYEDFGNQNFTINLLECVGFAGANDASFNIRLFHHSTAGWTYAASGFVPGGTVLANMSTDYNTEIDLANGEPISYKRTNLNTDISGSTVEGLVLEITTSANKAVEDMDIHIGVHTQPRYLYLAEVTQHTLFMKHGAAWHQV